MNRSVRASKRRILGLAALVTVATGALFWPRHEPNWVRASDRDAIYSSVFRRMMPRRERQWTGLSVGDNSPDAFVLSQFSKDKGVVPVSRIDSKGGSFKESTTGADAEIFSIEPETLRWYGLRNASIDVLAHGSFKDGYLGTYYLMKIGPRWVVYGYRDSGLQF